MCEFCHKHGEGKKWYLQAQNYSEDLLSDARRKEFIERFFTDTRSLKKDVRRLEALARAPKPVRDMVTGAVSEGRRKSHFGQVVPIEDIGRIFEFTNSVVRVACICRHVTLGKEKRYCYGVSLGPNGGKMAEILRGLDGSFLNGPHTAGLEISRPRRGPRPHPRSRARGALPHRVDLPHPLHRRHLQLRPGRLPGHAHHRDARRSADVPGRIRRPADPDLCTGCRQCMRVCQFGALAYSASDKKVRVDHGGATAAASAARRAPKARSGSRAVRPFPRSRGFGKNPGFRFVPIASETERPCIEKKSPHPRLAGNPAPSGLFPHSPKSGRHGRHGFRLEILFG